MCTDTDGFMLISILLSFPVLIKLVHGTDIGGIKIDIDTVRTSYSAGSSGNHGTTDIDGIDADIDISIIISINQNTHSAGCRCYYRLQL